MELVDSHCHLDYDYAPRSTEDLLREAKLAGVTRLVTIGTDVPSWARVAALSERFAEVYHTVGVHPHDAKVPSEDDWRALEAAARHPKCRGIGEIGLDYHYNLSVPEKQREVFSRQLEIALAVSQPVVVHTREAEEDTVRLLQEYAGRVPAGRSPGVIHCFTGTLPFGQACLDLGFYISFSGVITFKNADELRACARAYPLERLLVETDAPYLAPVPFRGKKCEPAMVRATAEKLAELRGVGLGTVAELTTRNARALFRLDT